MSNGTYSSIQYSYFHQPGLPLVVSEWAALIPLIIHLASPKGEHNLVGELALAGRLTLSILPKLGHLNGISRLFSSIPDFLDRASSKSDLSARIWDVEWGSSFPCANGAARDFLTRVALGKSSHIIDLEKRLSSVSKAENVFDDANAIDPRASLEMTTNHNSLPGYFRRYQTLHILEVHRGMPLPQSRLKRLWKVVSHKIHIPLLLILTVLLALFGAYGTAATALLCIITQVACRFVPVQRPPGYLQNNEKHQIACMLCAIHPNASDWYLYVGDRSSIDWLLNKTMITIDAKSLSPWARGFRAAHYLQLLAMTFVAGNKGWDGVCLLCLLVLNAIFKVIWEFPSHLAALQWISESNLTISAYRFRFTGRVPMLGAVQLLSTNRKLQMEGAIHGNVGWMDEILYPSERRRVWADQLSNIARRHSVTSTTSTPEDDSGLSDSDREWVRNNILWTKEAYKCIVDVLENSSAKPDPPQP